MVEQIADVAGAALNLAGIAVIVAGFLLVSARAGLQLARAERRAAVYRGYRRSLGHAILLGLELLVAADIIRTVAVEPTLETVAVLGLIVLVRTFLSFSLEVELDGRRPWQHAQPHTAE